MAPSVAEPKEPVDHVRPSTTSTAPSANETPIEPQTAPVLDEKSMGNAVEQTASDSLPGDDDGNDDNFEYPTAWRLAAITIALCLSVFCMALVRLSLCQPAFFLQQANLLTRTIQSLRLPSLASRISSRHSTMLAGTAAPTSSPHAPRSSSTANSTLFTRSNGSISPLSPSSNSAPSSVASRPTLQH
jgi:hypothetical protein